MTKNRHRKPSPVDLAALVYGCSTEDLLSYHEFEDSSVAIIAPTGQKFTYSAQRLREMLQELSEDPPPHSIAEEMPADLDGQRVFNEVLDRLIRELGLDEPAGERQPGSESSQAPQPAATHASPEQDLEEQNESTVSNSLPPQPATEDRVESPEPSSPLPHPTEVQTSVEEPGGAHAAKRSKPKSRNRSKNAAQHDDGSHQDD